jgi:hypothetical protein
LSRDVNFRDSSFSDLARAIGELALVWNDLGMVLSSLFHAVTRIPNAMASNAVWNSVRSDRAQRDMILSLVELQALGYDLSANLRTEIVWCLREIGKLEDLRNNVIHSPVYEDHTGKVVAWHELGNPRAKGLANKDLLKEIGWFYDTAVVLRQYCDGLSDCVGRPQKSLSTRPTLPNRGGLSPTKEN